MKKIIDWFGGSVVKDIMGGLDKLFTSKEEKMMAENAIKQILIQKQLELQKMQTEIIVTEAKGNWLQRSWRPILMLAFGFIVIYVKFIAPLFDLRIPELENKDPQRIFTNDQKWVIFQKSNKNCQSDKQAPWYSSNHCKQNIRFDDFHADHIVPHSGNPPGKTTVKNGQALCQPCNLRKSNSQ